MGATNSDKVREITVGIIGLGSIGIRHCEALVTLGVKKILALRTGKGNKIIPNHLINVIENISSYNFFQQADYFIVANPTALHADVLEKIIEFDKPVFIEKPLTDNLLSIKKIENLIKAKNFDKKIQVGFCLRYHPVIIEAKKIIGSGMLGKIYYAQLNVGQYLPLWHPTVDYRNEYFSRRELGGGAIRTLSHEIDLAQFFFGKPARLKSFVDKVSTLEVDVDDIAIMLLNFDNLISKIEIDFLQKKPYRKGIIHGEKADLHYNVFENKLTIYDTNGNCILNDIIPKNDMYLDQMRNFIDENKQEGFATFEESILQMKMIEAAENNSKNKQWEVI